MITIVIDNSGGVIYDSSSVSRVVPQFGVSLLEASFTIVGFYSTGHCSPLKPDLSYFKTAPQSGPWPQNFLYP
jgi:hypothetical protein